MQLEKEYALTKVERGSKILELGGRDNNFEVTCLVNT